jgi:hypothetical protein
MFDALTMNRAFFLLPSLAVAAFVLLLTFVWFTFSARTSRSILASSSAAAPSDPDEPCRVEAPPAARPTAENWCQGGGIFTRVNVKTDALYQVVSLQFSLKGQRRWATDKRTILTRFRRLTDEMGATTRLGVAYCLHAPDGILLGGCVRLPGSRESNCNW